MSTFNPGTYQSGDGNLNEPITVGRLGQPVKIGGGSEWQSVASGPIASRPSAIDFGIGQWTDDNGVMSISDGTKWTEQSFINNSDQFIPTIVAGTKSTFSGTQSSTLSGAGFNGWGYIYLRDNLTAFDTVTIAQIVRAIGLSGNDLWSSIVLEVVDMSDETSNTTFFNSTNIIASATLAVNPALDTISNLVFPLLDGLSRPITLNSNNLPTRFGIRYKARNSSGTAAVCGKIKTDVKTNDTVGLLVNSVPTRSVGNTYTAAFYLSAGVWSAVASAIDKALVFTLSLSVELQKSSAYVPIGKFNLNNFKSKLAKIYDGQTLAANIICIGDSWIQNNVIFARPVARLLKTRHGDAGPGFTGFGVNYSTVVANGADDTEATAALTGAWVTTTDTTSKGLDSSSIKSSTIGDSVVITLGGIARRAVIHYYAQPGGGDMQWKVGAGAFTTISTANATAKMLFAEIDFGSEITATTITIAVQTAGTAGVTLHGIDLRRDIAGVRVHKLGHAGAVASTFTSIQEIIWTQELVSLQPDLALINFTINEAANNISPEEMISNIRIIVRRIREVRPYCDICLISPSDNAMEVNTYKFAEYENAIYQLSIDLKCAYFPAKTVTGVFGDMLHNVLTGDTVPHPNSAGGELLGRTLVNELLAL